ncbi:MAG TPA: AraC family transcriptional regulator [Cytophagales bacterium]
MEITQYNPRCVRVALHVAFGDDEGAAVRFCRRIGIAYDALLAPAGHLSPHQFERIWVGLQEVFGTPHVGLLQGQRIGLSSGGLANLIAQVSPTLHEAMRQFGLHHALFTDPAYYQCFGAFHRGEEAGFEITLAPVIAEHSPVFARSTAECMFVVLVRALREYGKHPVQPVRVELAFDPPAEPEAYRAALQAPVTFGHGHNRLYFRRRDLDRPVLTHNAGLYRHFQEVVRVHLQGERDQSPTGRVRTVVLKRLNNHQATTLEAVAQDLAVSVRSLQRQLEGDGVTFGQLAEEARREVALQLVGRGGYSVAQIASLVGYDEPSSFRRAFKRWTGQTPKAFQAVGKP